MPASPLEQTRQARSVARIIVARERRAAEAALAQEAVPAILDALLDNLQHSLMHTVRICDLCWEDHFQPKPSNPSRDCLNVRCECWCTNQERPVSDAFTPCGQVNIDNIPCWLCSGHKGLCEVHPFERSITNRPTWSPYLPYLPPGEMFFEDAVTQWRRENGVDPITGEVL